MNVETVAPTEEALPRLDAALRALDVGTPGLQGLAVLARALRVLADCVAWARIANIDPQEAHRLWVSILALLPRAEEAARQCGRADFLPAGFSAAQSLCERLGKEWADLLEARSETSVLDDIALVLSLSNDLENSVFAARIAARAAGEPVDGWPTMQLQ